MGKSAVKGLFYICLIAATFVLATITIVAAFSGNVAPVDSVIMPLLGLAVPVLLIVNLITALCWALARKRWALVPLVAFFCNWGYLTSVFQLHLPKDKTPAGKYLKIATYNIHNFGGEITGYSCKEIARKAWMCCASRSSETTATSPQTAYGAYSRIGHTRSSLLKTPSRAYCLSPYSAAIHWRTTVSSLTSKAPTVA